MEKELTVVIATYNNPTGAQELVSDFYRLHDMTKVNLISVDQTKEGIKFKEDTPVHLHIRTYQNLGFSKSMNTGWKLVTTPYTVLANDDVRLLNAQWYEAAKTCVNKDGVLAVNPFPATRTWNAGGEPVWYWDTRPEDFNFIKDKPFEAYTEEDYQQLKKILTSSDGPGTTMFFTLLRTEARERIGLLDEAYWNGGEDYDWNRRVYLTCRHCNKRKHEHVNGDRCGFPKDGIQGKTHFQPYQILTCTHSLVHHQGGVTKQNAVKAKEAIGYDYVAKNKNIWKEKWGTPNVPDADIYGKTGKIQPEHWYQEIPL